jgi:outer membrane protein assembly factor BamB
LTLLSLASAGGDVGPRAAQIEEALRPKSKEVAAWPANEPRMTSVRRWKSLLGQWPVQFDRPATSELDCLSIDFKLTGFRVRNTGAGVHFTGCGQDSPWEIDLPKSDRSLGQSADYRQARSVGPLVLLQTGTGLHGLLPFDARGERGATQAWDVSWIDMWGSVTTHYVHFLPRLSDVAPGRHPLDVDDFGRPLTQVGPVTASAFCYREFGRLVACETSTGRRLWDRRDYDADAIDAGDESAVIIASPRRNRVEMLDPLTGALIGSQEAGVPASWWRRAIETTAILRQGESVRSVIPARQVDEPSELSAMNLKTGDLLWKQPIEAGAVDFTVGRRLVGAAESKSIRLFDAADGTEKGRVAIESLPDIADVYAVDDPFVLMICVFGPPVVEQLQPPLMLVGGRRRPYANGIVYGLDPRTLELKWTIPLDRSVFPLDQPRDIPLLAIHDAVIAEVKSDVPIREDRIRCFDKRTGRLVGQELRGEPVGTSGMVIERSHSAGWIELRTSKAIFRFDFQPKP